MLSTYNNSVALYQVTSRLALCTAFQHEQKILVTMPMFGEIFGQIGQDPSVSKSTWLHVDIFQFFIID